MEDDLRTMAQENLLYPACILGIADRRRDRRRFAGEKRAIWRQSSEPIDPPAPVTSTVRPPMNS